MSDQPRRPLRIVSDPALLAQFRALNALMRELADKYADRPAADRAAAPVGEGEKGQDAA